MPYKSYAFLSLKSRITKVEILVKNMIETIDEFTFKVEISEEKSTMSVVSMVLIGISACIFCILISTCCFRGILACKDSSGNINWDREEADPTWDED